MGREMVTRQWAPPLCKRTIGCCDGAHGDRRDRVSHDVPWKVVQRRGPHVLATDHAASSSTAAVSAGRRGRWM